MNMNLKQYFSKDRMISAACTAVAMIGIQKALGKVSQYRNKIV